MKSEIWQAFDKLADKCANYDTCDDFVELRRQIESLEKENEILRKVFKNSIVYNKKNVKETKLGWVSLDKHKEILARCEKLERVIDKMREAR